MFGWRHHNANVDQPARRQTTRLPAICFVMAALLVCCIGVAAAPVETPLAVQKVADGDYVHFGLVAMPTPDNAGDIANLGIIVGRDAVAMVDTGGSVSVGQRLLAGRSWHHRTSQSAT